MKTITTVREYDEQGRMVKETVSEVVTQDPYIPMPTYHCTCGTSVICPVHPGNRWWQAPPLPGTIYSTTVTPCLAVTP